MKISDLAYKAFGSGESCNYEGCLLATPCPVCKRNYAKGIATVFEPIQDKPDER